MDTIVSHPTKQLPLIHFLNHDDAILLETPGADWYRILTYFPWKNYTTLAAEYYDALYQFNKEKTQQNRSQDELNTTRIVETKQEAKQRIMFSRPTLDENAPILFQQPIKLAPQKTDPSKLAPGIVPPRLIGRAPKCFFALFKSFVGASLMGFPPEPEQVFNLLQSNLSFARVCGFIPKGAEEHYWQKHVPSLRKLEQFDQIMTSTGLWSKQKWDEVKKNINDGVIQLEKELVGDTTHYHAYSSFETIDYEDGDGKEQKKSQSKLTKSCRCDNWEQCSHPWREADDGAGTIVKSKTKIYWGHKAAILAFPQQGVPLDAAAVTDASTHDSKTLYPHVEMLFEKLPEIRDAIDTLLYDSACDDKDLKKQFQDDFKVTLKTSLNPRRKQMVTSGLPRGMKQLTPYGEVFCCHEQLMDYQGTRWDTEQFIYGPPRDEEGQVMCHSCPFKSECCPNATQGRTITISFDLLSHIDPNDPPMSKRFKALMSRRPAIERVIKRIKCDFSDDRLSKRGNASFQAHLDKTMIAFHIMLRE